MITKFKLYAIAFAGVVISALLVAVKFLTASNSRLRSRVESAEAKVHRARVIAKEDAEADGEHQSRSAEIARDLESGRTDYDPNELFESDDE